MKKRLLVFASTAILDSSSTMASAQVYVHIGPPPPAPREMVPAPMHRGWVGMLAIIAGMAAAMSGSRAIIWFCPAAITAGFPATGATASRGYVWIPGHWS